MCDSWDALLPFNIAGLTTKILLLLSMRGEVFFPLFRAVVAVTSGVGRWVMSHKKLPRSLCRAMC